MLFCSSRTSPGTLFLTKLTSESQAIIDIHNQYILAHQNGLEVLFVVDPFNGLNRREFQGLPSGWEASFANPKVRSSFSNYTLRIVQEFHPKYLGLASEINTYNDTHPEDFPNYLTLYNEVYARVKAVAPDTIIFVTFQWEELNNLIPSVAQGEPYVCELEPGGTIRTEPGPLGNLLIPICDFPFRRCNSRGLLYSTVVKNLETAGSCRGRFPLRADGSLPW